MIGENMLALAADHGHKVVIDLGQCQTLVTEEGFRVDTRNAACSLVQVEKGAKIPASAVAQIKKNKRYVIDLCVCSKCNRVTTSIIDIEMLKTHFNGFCDQGGCPYRPDRRF